MYQLFYFPTNPKLINLEISFFIFPVSLNAMELFSIPIEYNIDSLYIFIICNIKLQFFTKYNY